MIPNILNLLNMGASIGVPEPAAALCANGAFDTANAALGAFDLTQSAAGAFDDSLTAVGNWPDTCP